MNGDINMALTPKQEAFAKLVAEGLSQSDAYRSAYNSKAKPETVQANASRLMADSRVSARVAELRQQLAEVSLWSRMDSVMVLSEIAKGNDSEAKPADRVNAVKALNQMHGWDKQVIDHTSSDGSMSPTRIEIVAKQ
jgi:phage terminase small subunit